MYIPEVEVLTGSEQDSKGHRDGPDGNNDRSLALSRPHLSPRRSTSARDTILSAVEMLELDNQRLRDVNNKMAGDMAALRLENEQLTRDLDATRRDLDATRRDLDATRRDREDAINRCSKSEETRIAAEERMREECRKVAELEASLRRDREAARKQYEKVKAEVSRKEVDVRALVREMDALRSQLAQVRRQHADQNDIETFHELQMLKAECKELVAERDRAEKTHRRLSGDIGRLEASLDEKLAELRNENRRHSLLTKEFNSLLEENSRLKLQLRRGGHVTSGPWNGEEGAPENRLTAVGGSQTQRRTLMSYSTRPPSSESTSLRSRDRIGSTRGYKLAGRIAMDRYGRRERRPLASISQSPGSRSDSDSSQSPESLPNIAGSRTWRPL